MFCTKVLVDIWNLAPRIADAIKLHWGPPTSSMSYFRFI